MMVKTVYECEVCGKIDDLEKNTLVHEAECHRRIDERAEKALTWVKTNKPVLLLVAHGFEDEARELCLLWARKNLWYCGSQDRLLTLINTMLDVVKQMQEVEHLPIDR